MRPNILFGRERGFSSGLTHEVFESLAKEFCRKSLRVWRTEFNSQE
jgi:hypothetical protein